MSNLPEAVGPDFLWRIEHGADFAVPDILTLDPELVDVSWHNDVCPSFINLRDADDHDHETCATLWAHHIDPEEREMKPHPRFAVSIGDDTLVLTDDVNEAIRVLKATERRISEGAQ